MSVPPEPNLRLERGDGLPAGASSSRGGDASTGRLPLALDREVSLRARIMARDERALSELIAVASPWLLGVAKAMLHDMDDAEDVVMDAFRTLWTTLDTRDDAQVGLMPLLLRMTRQRAIDRLRQRKRGVRLVTVLTPTAVATSTVAATEPNEAAQPGWQVHTSVHAALAALPAEQRTAVSLAYFEGLAQSEIASTLGIPLGTVKTRLRLALVRLRSALAPLKDWVP